MDAAICSAERSTVHRRISSNVPLKYFVPSLDASHTEVPICKEAVVLILAIAPVAVELKTPSIYILAIPPDALLVQVIWCQVPSLMALFAESVKKFVPLVFSIISKSGKPPCNFKFHMLVLLHVARLLIRF